MCSFAMRYRLLLALLLLVSGSAWAASCTLTQNAPPYGLQTLPGSQRNITIIETCANNGTPANYSASGGTTTITGTGFTLVNGKSIILSGMPAPYNEQFNNVTFTLTAASSTSFSFATPHTVPATITSTSVSGATVIQPTKINYSQSHTVGTITGSLSCTSNCPPTVSVVTDSTLGNCPDPPSSPSGSYTLTSTQTLDIKATSVDDPTQTADTVFRQCAKTTAVHFNGAHYYPIYQNQVLLLYAAVVGNVNTKLTFAITSQPSGGDGAFVFTDFHSMAFNGTVTGRYVVTATSVDDPTKSDTTIIWIAPKAYPPYATLPPNKAEPQVCGGDPASLGTVFDVGPTQTFTSINAVTTSAAWSATGGKGNIMRLHNEDTTGHSPTTFVEYTQIQAGGSYGDPVQLCGVPDSLGNYPVMDGDHAKGPTWSNVGSGGFGIVSTLTHPCFELWQGGTCGPSYVRIAGIKFIHANASYQYFEPDGVTLTNWQFGADGVNLRTGIYITVSGNEMILTGQGIGTYDNVGQAGGITMFVDMQRNHMDQNGDNGSSQSHPAYLQNYWGDFVGNLIGSAVSGSSGSCMKDRGLNIVFAYNRCGQGYARYFDGVNVQDSPYYVDYLYYLGPIGDTTCADSPYCLGDTLGINGMAANQEALFRDVVYGSVYDNGSGTAVPIIHEFQDNGDDQVSNYTMSCRYGTLYFFYNTINEGAESFDVATQVAFNRYLNQNFYIADNIDWSSTTQFSFNSWAPFIAKFQTNLGCTGCIDNTTPITGSRFNNADTFGWTNAWLAGTSLMSSPLDPYITGNLTSDFLTTGTQPFNSSTFIPPPGSAAISAASAITGYAAEYTVYYNAVNASGVLIPRMTTADIGAMDSDIPPPTLASMALTANPASAILGTNYTFTCIATMSDLTTRNPCSVVAAVSWASTTGHVTINSSGVATAVSLGTSVITAAIGGIVSDAPLGDTMTVIPVPPHSIDFGVHTTTGNTIRF